MLQAGVCDQKPENLLGVINNWQSSTIVLVYFLFDMADDSAGLFTDSK